DAGGRSLWMNVHARKRLILRWLEAATVDVEPVAVREPPHDRAWRDIVDRPLSIWVDTQRSLQERVGNRERVAQRRAMNDGFLRAAGFEIAVVDSPVVLRVVTGLKTRGLCKPVGANNQFVMCDVAAWVCEDHLAATAPKHRVLEGRSRVRVVVRRWVFRAEI